MSISVSKVRVPGWRALAIRVTLPSKVRLGIAGTRMTASTPGFTPNAESCGTYTQTRITSPCTTVNIAVPLVALAVIKLPTSMFRCVTMPSNGATTCV